MLRIWLGNKKTLPKAEFFVEHVQESVLVSTLKRCSALLTQVHIESRQVVMVALRVSLVTGTVAAANAGSCKESLAAGSGLRLRPAGRCYAVMKKRNCLERSLGVAAACWGL